MREDHGPRLTVKTISNTKKSFQAQPKTKPEKEPVCFKIKEREAGKARKFDRDLEPEVVEGKRKRSA